MREIIMWLPKDERKTLVFYYHKWVAGSSSFPFKDPWDESVHLRLRDRDLILLDIDIAGGRVSLTPEGRRLGQGYDSWWFRSNLWYTEYVKNHWICVVCSFLGGVLATLFVQWLSRG
jgi:hypothetical protein